MCAGICIIDGRKIRYRNRYRNRKTDSDTDLYRVAGAGGTKQANSKYLDSCNLVLSRLLGHRARKYAAHRVLRCSNP